MNVLAVPFITEWASLIGVVAFVASVTGYAIHHACIERGCYRPGHPDPMHGHPVCRKHQSKVS